MSDAQTTTTASAAEPPALDFQAPGPGSWERDVDHQSEPAGRLSNEIFNEVFTEGFRHTFAAYGMPLETLEAKAVHGWTYMHPVVAGAPDKGGAAPPDFVIKLLSRLHPEFRRRNRKARKALAEKRWLTDAASWAQERQAFLDRSDRLLTTCRQDDEPSAATVVDALDGAEKALRRHFELVGTAVATGRLLVAGEAWGIRASEVGRLLKGASPTTAATTAPLAEMAEMVSAAGTTPETVAELRAISTEVNECVDAYLSRWGAQTIGGGFEGSSLAEEPDHLVRLVNNAVAGRGATEKDHEFEQELRSRIPLGEQSHFDELVAEARIVYGSLEDHSAVAAQMAGVLRTVILALAGRAVAAGKLEVVDDAWNLSRREIVELAEGTISVNRGELVRRRDARAAASAAPAPMILGDDPSPPPDASLFPKPMREVVRSLGAFIEQKFTSAAPTTVAHPDAGSLVIEDQAVATGQLIGTNTATGRLVVATDIAAAIDQIEPGDILVCACTSVTWNSIFPLLAGIVTATGGPLGHTAIMAREFEIPAIVGVGEIDPAWDGATASITAATVEASISA